MTDTPAPPPAPWVLTGRCVVAAVGARLPGQPLPAGLHRLPGPALMIAADYRDSPVGPYRELAVGVPVRRGARPGLCITTMVVDSDSSRAGGRANWGYPKEVGTLEWTESRGAVSLRWVERGITVSAQPRRRLAVPAYAPLVSLQQRGDDLVVVPGRIRGRTRVCRVEVVVPGRVDPLAPLAGRHLGVAVDDMRFEVRPARS